MNVTHSSIFLPSVVATVMDALKSSPKTSNICLDQILRRIKISAQIRYISNACNSGMLFVLLYTAGPLAMHSVMIQSLVHSMEVIYCEGEPLPKFLFYLYDIYSHDLSLILMSILNCYTEKNILIIPLFYTSTADLADTFDLGKARLHQPK